MSSVCKTCGSDMSGDGYTLPMHCETIEAPTIAPDSDATYCSPFSMAKDIFSSVSPDNPEYELCRLGNACLNQLEEVARPQNALRSLRSELDMLCKIYKSQPELVAKIRTILNERP